MSFLFIQKCWINLKRDILKMDDDFLFLEEDEASEDIAEKLIERIPNKKEKEEKQFSIKEYFDFESIEAVASSPLADNYNDNLKAFALWCFGSIGKDYEDCIDNLFGLIEKGKTDDAKEELKNIKKDF